jgi:hypothetical protein
MFDPWYFFIVHGYGCDLETPLKPYLEFVGTRISQDLPGTVILTGGATQQEKFPGKTEAGVMAQYLRERVRRNKSRLPLLIEEADSFTTDDNVRNACARIRRTPGIADNWHRVRVHAFCEAQRALKSEIHYWDLLPEIREYGQRVWIETCSWELADPRQELVKTNTAVVTRRFPVVGRLLSRIRRRGAQHR